MTSVPHCGGHAWHECSICLRAGCPGERGKTAEWWHWSYADRYWALAAGAPAALYGPVADTVAR